MIHINALTAFDADENYTKSHIENSIESQIKSNQIYFSVSGKTTHNIKVYI